MATKTDTIIKKIDRRTLTVYLVGESGIYFNSMSAKAMRDLLMPPKKKTTAERASSLKHDPRAEFRNSVYRHVGSESYLGFPSAGLKAAMASAALVTEGVKKSDVQKLLFVEGETVPIYGRPYLRCDVVRSADMNRTPDVRTRAFIPEWATKVQISYTVPNLTADGVVNLLANAGETCGIGDFRQEKGRGNFGRWRIVNEGDAEFERIRGIVDYEDQRQAMQDALSFDSTTEQLLEYFDEQVSVRELVAVA